MKIIPLTQGKFAQVDDQDFDRLRQYSWQAHRSGPHKGYYAWRSSPRENGKQKIIKMHREILGASDDALSVDHRDGDGLNNTRRNLRLATRCQNARNSKVRRDNKSGFKGVSRNRNRFWARIHLGGRNVSLGGFSTAESAAYAYDQAAILHFGDFAKTNFPRETAAKSQVAVDGGS